MIEQPSVRNWVASLRGSKRPGAVLPIMAVFVVILLVMAAFSIDIAYMELVKVQLRSATDAAAKAGTSALVQGKSNDNAKLDAINMAAMNHVAGKSLSITTADISLGQSVLQPNGTWQFVAGLQPYQAVQIQSSMSSSNTNGNVSLFFGPFMGVNHYAPTNMSVASAFACEVCLVLDRSHSMCWDETGDQNSHPAPIFSDISAGIQSPPLDGSRWMALDAAVNTFCGVLKGSNSPPRVGVVTWASDIGTNTMEYMLTGQTSEASTIDLDLSTNLDAVYATVQSHSQNVMLGGTNMSEGINQGTTVLTGPNVRTYAKKIMILMTDGQWNAGVDPVTAAAAAASQNITIHCICFLKNADQTTSQQIASMTGGRFYYVEDSAGLAAAFQQLAYSLPVVLTR